jgi:hypothetical protein
MYCAKKKVPKLLINYVIERIYHINNKIYFLIYLIYYKKFFFFDYEQ